MALSPLPLVVAALDFTAVDWLGLGTLLGLGFIIAWTTGLLYIRTSLQNPPRRTYATALSRNQPGTPLELDHARFGLNPRAFTEWRLKRPGGGNAGELPVWEIPGDDPSGPTVIFTHGWADGRIGGLLRLEPFIPRASRVLLWDMVGHGDAPRSAGPCRLGRIEHRDLLALIEQTTGPVILFGWSLGAGVSIVAGTHPRVIAVACEAPYSLPQIPASRVMAARGMPGMGLLPVALTTLGGSAWQRAGGSFDRRRHAAALNVPLLVLHGENDPVCPIDDGRAIAVAARSGTLAPVAGARHNDLWITPQFRSVCRSALEQWLEALPQQQSIGPALQAALRERV